MRRAAWIASLAIALGAGLGPPRASGAPSGPGEATVTARLIADRAAIAPGDTFSLGIEIRMAPGWHTYWENGGDAGLPTDVEWMLPEGFRAGEIQWPVPHRYEEAGDLVTFGYTDYVLLVTDVTPPADLPPEGEVDLRGTVDWLQCKEICIPGAAEVSIRLPVAPAPRPATKTVVRKFEQARALHPRSAMSVAHVALHPFQSPHAIHPGEVGEVAVVFAGLRGFDASGAEFFPRPSVDLWFRDGRFTTDGENLGLVVPVEVDAAVEPGTVVALPGLARIPRRDGGEPWILAFEVPLAVAEPGETPRASTAPVFTGAPGPLLAPGTAPVSSAAAPPVASSLLRYLLLAFLGGIILNVMPCVLPVVSLKVLGFVSKADEDPAKVTRLGFIFAAGVVTSFLVLAGLVISLQAAGQHLGWGFQFQNPAFVAGLSIVVFLFALSLLGVFEIGVTMSLVGLGVAAAERKDYADAFFHGVLTTILATPCTAPMLGTAIAFAFSQPAWIILLIFTTVALGLAFPYVLLSMHPGWLRYVPKPGAWMETFKQSMGFLLLATLVWLLSVFGVQTGTSGLVWFLAFLLVLGLFAWIHGRFLDLTSRSGKRATIWAVTVVGVAWSYQAFLHDTVFPGEGTSMKTRGLVGLSERSEISEHGTVWEPFSTEYLDEAVSAGRTVFIDFTAEWCWTCKVNEKTVLADAEIEELFRANRVLTLKGDWTRKDPEITEILRRHNRAGVPFYAVYPAGRPADVIVLPEIINKKLVIRSLLQAGPSVAPGV